jgi:alkylhydroperoxidase family enzyme
VSPLALTCDTLLNKFVLYAWIKEEHSMEEAHAVYAQRLIEAVLTSPGDTEPSVRQSVEALSAQLGGRPSSQTDAIPPELISYIKKVALHAYKTTDEDIEALRKAGFSEDAIFEITVSAALGAGMARLERGLTALKDDEE